MKSSLKLSINQEELQEKYQSEKSDPNIITGRPRWYVCIATFLLYLSQIVPCAIFITLYPVLYGLRGFSEDDLSFLELGAIPWCLKFVVGYVF